MKKCLPILFMLCVVIGLTGCSPKNDVTYSLDIRNYGEHTVTLKKVMVNNQVYLDRAMELLPATEGAPSGKEYLLLFNAKKEINVTVIFEDNGRETAFSQQLTDTTGNGFTILVTYNRGFANFKANTVGGLTIWGN